MRPVLILSVCLLCLVLGFFLYKSTKNEKEVEVEVKVDVNKEIDSLVNIFKFQEALKKANTIPEFEKKFPDKYSRLKDICSSF
jgi:hypothetical protein